MTAPFASQLQPQIETFRQKETQGSKKLSISSSEEEIKEYIKILWGAEADRAIRIFSCESELSPTAFNPETEAKARGVTKWSSCGVAQNNDPRCDDKSSIVYDYRYNLELGYQKYLERGWSPWKNCAVKAGLL